MTINQTSSSFAVLCTVFLLQNSYTVCTLFSSGRWSLHQQKNTFTLSPENSQSPWGDTHFCYNHFWIQEDFTVCGDGFCKCKEQIADCSHNSGNLTYIPQLPDNVTWLAFTHNNLTSIPSDFFVNVTYVNVLDISYNGVTSISDGALGVFDDLATLCVTYSKLTYDTLAPVLNIKTLRVLDVSNRQLGAPPVDLFYKYPLYMLESLALMFDGIASLNISMFAPLEKLNYLSLCGNRLTEHTFSASYLPQLLSLDLARNSFGDMFESCQGTESLFPNLSYLSLSRNNFGIIQPPKVCLPILSHLFLDSTNLEEVFPDMFQSFPSLSSLSMTVSFGTLRIRQHGFRHPQLKHVDISYSYIDFSRDVVSADMFAGCPALQSVNLSHNRLDIPDIKFNRLFAQAPNITHVMLDSANIDHINKVMFKKLSKISEIRLRENRISEIPDGTFDGFLQLQRLYLRYNRIQTVREATFSARIRERLHVLSLSNNAFQCDCDLRWFQHWLLSQPSLFQITTDMPPFRPKSENTYVCTNLVNTSVQSFFVADQTCVWSPAVSKFIIASIVLLVLPLAMATALYRYRWHIRLVLFEAFRGQDDRWRRLREQNFRYDVFVSYDSQDLGWVRAHLMPELEGRLGLRLCIHERDFTLGVPIVKNIEDSVQTSKKVLMVFSRNFARSEWCQFELQLCLSHVMEQGDVLLVVLLEDIPSRELTPAMVAVMKTTTYIEWADQEDDQHSFWQRLRLALQEILPPA